MLQPPQDDEEIPQLLHHHDEGEEDDIHSLSRTDVFDSIKLRLQNEEKLAEEIFKLLKG